MEPSRLLDWRGRTAIVIGSGPSLTERDCEVASLWHGARTIAVNASFRRMPIVHTIYMGDYQAVKLYSAEAKRKAQVWTCSRLGAEQHHANFVPGLNADGLGHKAVHLNGNSGFQAINLAFLFGARRVILLGFDMKPAPDGRRHWHDEHPKPLVQASQFGEWIHKSKKLAADLEAAGCKVINCTPGSALTCFPQRTLSEELCHGLT